MSLAIINNNYTMNNTSMKNEKSSTVNRRQVIKRKVLAIGKMSRNYNVLREHAELVQQLKSVSLNGKLPVGMLASGEQGIREAILQKTLNCDVNIKLKEQNDPNLLFHHQPTPNLVSREGQI